MTRLPDTLPVVAVVGRPNVGKSTLFNRLVGGHDAIVEDEPGVTRDRRYGEAEWDGRRFRVVDTGGLDPGAMRGGPLAQGIWRQAMRAVDEAELVVFVADARTGLSASDHAAVDALRKTGKPILWVANKIDSVADEPLAVELYRAGADQVYGISAQHGRGIAELLDAILSRLPGAPRLADAPEADPAPTIRIALVGRPNAGKSSLINRFAGEERMLVDAKAGTTRDPVDTAVEIAGQKYLLIDTAGIRRRARVEAPMEKIAVAMAEKAVNRADVCVLVVDAAEGVAEQEAKIAGLCDSAGRALVVCFNKLDLIDHRNPPHAPRGGPAKQDVLHEELNRKLQFVPWAKVVFVSAKTGKGVQRLFDAVKSAFSAYTRRVTTGELNRWFETIVEKHPPSLYRGHPVKLYFIQQPEARPPTFILSVNHPDGVHFSYRRYLQNQLREKFGLDGTPIKLVCRARSIKARRRRGVKAR